jgi:hypothetical protein
LFNNHSQLGNNIAHNIKRINKVITQVGQFIPLITMGLGATTGTTNIEPAEVRTQES